MPEIGQISRRDKEGLQGRGRIIWRPCSICEIPKWFPVSKPNQVCVHCSAKERNKDLQVWRESKNHRVDCKCSTCKPIDQNGNKNPLWKGGKTRVGKYIGILVTPDDQLYEMGDVKNHYVLEHRLVMARHIGRPLGSNETVHHKNGIKTDNRIENLELWVGNHGSGMRVEDIINEYAAIFGYVKK